MIQGLYIAAALLGLSNGLAVLLVNPRRTINRVYFAGTLITCVWIFSLLRAIAIGEATAPTVVNPDLLFWLRMSSATPALIVWQIALMRQVLIEDIHTVRQALRISWPWFAVSAALASLAFSEFFIPSYSTTAAKLRGPGYHLFLFAIAACGLWLLVDSVRRMRRFDGIKRLELQFFVAYALLASLLVVASAFIGHLFPDLAWLRRSGPIWITIWQASIMWAVCHHKIFEGRQVVALVGQRLLLLGLLGFGAVGLQGILLPHLGQVPAMALAAMTAAGLAVLWDPPLRRWLGLEARQQLDAPRRQIVSWAREGLDENRLIARLEGFLREWCKTDLVRLLPFGDRRPMDPHLPADSWPGWSLLNREGWITLEAIQRQKESAATRACRSFLESENLSALLAVPQGSPAPSLLVALGRKHSLRPYTFPDIRLLLELAELMDNILTHSRVAAHSAAIEKMESAAMMSRGLAHDLNNLATPVSTFLLHMEGRVTPGTAEAEVLADAKQSIRVMQDYIRESLFYARRLVPDFQPVSSTELLASTVGLTQTRAKARGVEVVVGPSAGLAFRADRVLLLRMLQNLVSNGIDATPEGGRVILAAEPHGLEHIRFTVTDEGPGVPAALVSRIFEPYFTTKDTGNRTRGLGLGLAISLKIGSLHGGTITVGRASSGGAVFTATLPLSPRSPV